MPIAYGAMELTMTRSPGAKSLADLFAGRTGLVDRRTPHAMCPGVGDLPEITVPAIGKRGQHDSL